ncbi:YdcF family protein [Paenibacillus rubinfantis]|uniref:YdcF family protein n=1 Tax=Paenibacillus rubinfantis TaxID=1720296 RepID=UPI00073FA121|nr:YdcF family protein [Paenibacillus rubinfantis]
MRYAKPNVSVRGGTNGSQRKGRVRKRIFRWGLVLILLGVGWSLFVLAQIGSVERNPAANTDLSEPAEVGIVLGAAMWGDEPSPGLRERLEQSLKDFEAGKFKWFLLTGGLDTPTSNYTEAEGMANYLEQHGVPRDKMLLENKATSTYENLKFSQEMMMERGFASALIITHTYHGNRALEIARALDYKEPKLSLTESKVLKPIPNTFREILAYSKWKLDQLGLALGIIG